MFGDYGLLGRSGKKKNFFWDKLEISHSACRLGSGGLDYGNIKI